MGDENKGKEGKYCPFRKPYQNPQTGKVTEQICNNFCALFCEGLRSCVLHGMNNNLRELNENIKLLRKLKNIKD